MIQKETRYYSDDFLRDERESEVECPTFAWARKFPGELLRDLDRWSDRHNCDTGEWRAIYSAGLHPDDWVTLGRSIAKAVRASVYYSSFTTVGEGKKLRITINFHGSGKHGVLATLSMIALVYPGHKNCEVLHAFVEEVRSEPSPASKEE